jgi:enamine deaminase RidA (YjgF/YER057c/UK114 family)
MASRKLISSGAKWEDIVGYSRAVRVGNIIEVAGTTAAQGGKVQYVGDAYKQTIMILKIINGALIEAGGSLSDVIRTRMYVCNIEDWQEIGRAHGEFFSTIKPASTMVEVSKLVDPEMLVEIEVSAIIQD